jgi:hypothetical protein
MKAAKLVCIILQPHQMGQDIPITEVVAVAVVLLEQHRIFLMEEALFLVVAVVAVAEGQVGRFRAGQVEFPY